MFLLFELRRPDVWPVDDLGVRHGWRLIHEPGRPARARRRWTPRASASGPHRSTVALLLLARRPRRPRNRVAGCNPAESSRRNDRLGGRPAADSLDPERQASRRTAPSRTAGSDRGGPPPARPPAFRRPAHATEEQPDPPQPRPVRRDPSARRGASPAGRARGCGSGRAPSSPWASPSRWGSRPRRRRSRSTPARDRRRPVRWRVASTRVVGGRGAAERLVSLEVHAVLPPPRNIGPPSAAVPQFPTDDGPSRVATAGGHRGPRLARRAVAAPRRRPRRRSPVRPRRARRQRARSPPWRPSPS